MKTFISLLLLLSGCQIVEVDEHRHFMVMISSSSLPSVQANVWYECTESSTTRYYKIWESTHAIYDVNISTGGANQ